MDLKSVDGMYQSILDIGEMFGKQEEAQQLFQEFEDFKAEYADRTEGDAPKVLILSLIHISEPLSTPYGCMMISWS